MICFVLSLYMTIIHHSWWFMLFIDNQFQPFERHFVVTWMHRRSEYVTKSAKQGAAKAQNSFYLSLEGSTLYPTISRPYIYIHIYIYIYKYMQICCFNPAIHHHSPPVIKHGDGKSITWLPHYMKQSSNGLSNNLSLFFGELT